jgi:hypothetical protein
MNSDWMRRLTAARTWMILAALAAAGVVWLIRR